ncbi:hypothetical protein GTO27_03295 [Candidatus Bathyarchaeota archaeon]|nr:hypothetical protein [Candidatus Bathyarchaeota archaeon]
MKRYAKVFEAEESKEESLIELGCFREALEKNLIVYHTVYKCYFDNASQSCCTYPERPKDPKICKQSLCSKWLERLAINHKAATWD